MRWADLEAAPAPAAPRFPAENPFLDLQDPLAEVPRLLAEQRQREALLALQADVQRHPQSSEGWRQLGQLYADLDFDAEALSCLHCAQQVDPYNLEALMELGICHTNERNWTEAARCFRSWVEHHEEYSELALVNPAPDDADLLLDHVQELLAAVHESKPDDAQPLTAMAALYDRGRTRKRAQTMFAEVCRLCPHDACAWNRLGVALDSSTSRRCHAVLAYQQSLRLRPTRVRTWRNLAVTHATLKLPSDAMRFLCSALLLHPSNHLWVMLERLEPASEALRRRDLTGCQEFVDATLPDEQQPLAPADVESLLQQFGL